ncbi:MAG: selenide, water dikinase SelD [Pseudobdellovibrionaceae bacterium]
MVKLTQTVQKGGCAAKIAADELKNILKQIEFPPRHQTLLIDGSTFDDAAVDQVSEEIALVQTLDFFTPIVDTPYAFGEIAAANALSDVYAMGGAPKTAMAILAFPLASMESSVIVEVLRGASAKIAEAKAMFVGGHSIDDDTLKFGLSVTGYVHPKKIWKNSGAKPGDHLILTKPLGTGCAAAALKRREVTESDIENQLRGMATLNNVIDFISETFKASIHAATDVTGFGLMGHALQMAQASHVELEIEFNQLPLYPRTIDFLERGFLTKAHKSNRTYVERFSEMSLLSELQKLILFDPQTSGGLLLSVDPSHSDELLREIQNGFSTAKRIGKVKRGLTEKVQSEIFLKLI